MSVGLDINEILVFLLSMCRYQNFLFNKLMLSMFWVRISDVKFDSKEIRVKRVGLFFDLTFVQRRRLTESDRSKDRPYYTTRPLKSSL